MILFLNSGLVSCPCVVAAERATAMLMPFLSFVRDQGTYPRDPLPFRRVWVKGSELLDLLPPAPERRFGFAVKLLRFLYL
jgi:hypothetical protein